MVVGDPSAWTARFRTLDVRFLERVVAVWPSCVEVLPNDPHEDTITENLVVKVSRDPMARRLFHHLEYHYEPFGFTAEGRAFSKGKIDMAVLLDQERDHYLAYECKRLNVPRNGGLRSLATEYVTDGVRRFVTEQYAACLPVGCMLGYVLDGDASGATIKVLKAIDAQRDAIGLLSDPERQSSIGPIPRFSTRHGRGPRTLEIEVRHALLPFPAQTCGGTFASAHDGDDMNNV